MDLELLSAITELFERQDAKLEERLSKQDSKFDKLDERFSKQESKLEKLDERLSKQESKLDKLQINQEAVIIPKIELLFEGHKGLADKIERVAPPENIQDRVETLEAAVKYLSSELNRLKKAE